MRKTSLMFSLILVFALVFLVSCGNSQYDKLETVQLNTKLSIPGLPTQVASAGKDRLVTLTQLKLEKTGGNLVGTVNFQKGAPIQKGTPDDFLAILCLSSANTFLQAEYSADSRYIFISPAGQNGNVGFTMEGYKKPKANQIQFSLPLSMYGLYDINDFQGTAYVFLLSTKQEQSVAHDQYTAISNILKAQL